MSLHFISPVEHHSNELIVNLIAVNESQRKAEADAVLDEMLKARVELGDFDKQKRLEVLGWLSWVYSCYIFFLPESTIRVFTVLLICRKDGGSFERPLGKRSDGAQ
jgi:hypothetical protein